MQKDIGLTKKISAVRRSAPSIAGSSPKRQSQLRNSIFLVRYRRFAYGEFDIRIYIPALDL
jgi:hypothetical protein